jgi:hypothetical protein
MARTFKYTYGYEPYETLPPVSADDNGKVLGVSNGSYALVNGGGGGGSTPYFVEDTVHGTEGATITLNKKFSEILNAFLNGEYIVFKQATPDGFIYDCLTAISDMGSDGGDVKFAGDYMFGALTPDDYPTNNL